MKILKRVFFLLPIVLSSCNFSNRITFQQQTECILVKEGSFLTKFDITTSKGLYFFQIKKGIKSSKFCFDDFNNFYSVIDINPANLRKNFSLPKNETITFNNNSYSDMASFEITLFVDSLGKITLAQKEQ